MKPVDSIGVLQLVSNENPKIKFYKLIDFEPYDVVQNRVDMSGELNPVFERALVLREQYKLPFWDAFNVNLFDRKLSKFDFLDQILFHNSACETREVYIGDVLHDQLKFGSYTTVSSMVGTENKCEHLFLLDFHIPVSGLNQLLCESVALKLGLTGYLLDSGKSYHFIGNRILTEVEWRQKMYFALLLAPIIDRAWITHQLIQNYGCLRVSPKYGRLPILVKKIE